MINRDSEETIRTQLILQEQFLNQKQKDKPQQKKRLLFLDIYRGLTVFGMLIVDNCSKDCPSYLDHPAWDGLNSVDLIFPAFLFIIGFSIPLSINQKNPIRFKNFLRIGILFLLGVFINLTADKFDFSDIQIMGILQRCSLCYFGILMIHILTKKGALKYRMYGLLIMMVIIFIYIACMLSFDKPQIGCPKQKNLTKQCNFVYYWNKIILNANSQPEGLFSTLTALGTSYFGYLFCLIYRDKKSQPKRFLTQWVIISVMIGLTVYPLTFIMPLNKKIYSVSFMTLTISVCGLSMAIFMSFFDVYMPANQSLSKIVSIIIKPFLWLGKNPLIIFVLMYEIKSILDVYIFINQISLWQNMKNFLFQSWISEKQISSVMFSCFIAIIWTILAGILHHKKIFIKL